MLVVARTLCIIVRMSAVPPPLPGQVAEQLWYYTDSKNEPVGPVSLAALKQLAAVGVIRSIDYVREKGKGEWVRFDSICPSPVLPSVDPDKSLQTSDPTADAWGTVKKELADAPYWQKRLLGPIFFPAAFVFSHLGLRFTRQAAKVLYAFVFLLLVGMLVGSRDTSSTKETQAPTPNDNASVGASFNAPPVQTSDDRIRSAVRDALGRSLKGIDIQKGDGGSVVWVDFDAASIVSGRKLRVDEKMKDVYQALFTKRELGIQSVTISVFLPFGDKYGNEASKVGYRTRMDNQTGQRIKWESRYSLNFDELWQVLFIHPSFQTTG